MFKLLRRIGRYITAAMTGKFNEVADPAGRVFAKGLSSHAAARVKEWAGRRTADLPPDVPHEVIHRDDLIVLP